MSLTSSQILDLAPDASSRKAGQDQAKAAGWSGLGRAGDVVWGEIKGSGATPYRTVADVSGPSSKCTCPSRKFPCKHALGLMLANSAAPLVEAAPPDWVAAWIQARESRAASTEGRSRETAPPIDDKGQAKRRRAREGKVTGALDELDLWLGDLMRRGLATVRREPYAFWDRMAGRLVDGQASGLARRVRAMPGLVAAPPEAGAARPEAALALALGRLSLLVRAARRLDALAPEQAAGVRAAIGYPVTADEMAGRPNRIDDWRILAHVVEEEDKLTARTVWLVGRKEGALAQVIDYGTSGSPLPPVPAVGQEFSGALAFHPGDPPLRAVFREGRTLPMPAGALPVPADVLPGATSVAVALDGFADVLARAPWIERWPVRLSGLRLGHVADGAFAAGDATGRVVLRPSPHLPALMAVAAGGPVDLFGLYDGFGLAPLALVADGHLYAIPARDPRPILMRAA
ncbi:SWIM zinc finger family protein [Methylobacterium sp. 77]|uniref:SWIM zinc finger family protein n=1 Tax=Methylobacterium sp. 77 TaxID=1101192 RepID=UPI00037615D2|nr:SWIM zinc finger family protein [Methylobacterium sp. 77]